jgi:predicted choloylglycine hydrolase
MGPRYFIRALFNGDTCKVVKRNVDFYCDSLAESRVLFKETIGSFGPKNFG